MKNAWKMKLSDIIRYLESEVSILLQEDYDNSGLICGNPEKEIDSALVCVDVTQDVLYEAIENDISLIVSHHPLIFSGIKKLSGRSYVERILINAIKNDIAIYCMHTNLDNVIGGVNHYLARAIGLEKCRILSPMKGLLRKLVTFCPVDHADKVREALFEAGAGHIGNYDSCSYNLTGKGTFKAGDHSDPYVGEKGKIHFEEEVRIETIYPVYKEQEIIVSLIRAHPYEEVAYDLYPLENIFDQTGAGMLGYLNIEMDDKAFLKYLKGKLDLHVIRHSQLFGKTISKVAICGGSGSFLIKKAIASGADAFITGDLKYHQFFDAEERIVLIDIGHYESEKYTKELIFDLIKKKFPKFAVQISEINTNAVHYFS